VKLRKEEIKKFGYAKTELQQTGLTLFDDVPL
jgi:hypothetical protein